MAVTFQMVEINLMVDTVQIIDTIQIVDSIQMTDTPIYMNNIQMMNTT